MWLAAVCGAVLYAAAQPASASLGGLVRDATTGEPVAGALVTLPDVERATLSDALGRYRFAQLPAGPQHLSVQRLGFRTRTLHVFIPQAGTLTVHVALQAAPLPLQPLAVRPPVRLRGSEPVDSALLPALALSAAAVRNHPLLAEPDFFQGLAGGAVIVQPEAPSGVHLRGGATDHLAYLLDGVPVFSPYHSGWLFSAWNPDALARVQVEAVAPAPSAGAALAGVIMGETRAPATVLRAQGTLSTTQARATLDGPLPGARGGFLLSGRAGFPALLKRPSEASYVRGGSGDGLAKLETDLARGRLRLLAYARASRVSAAGAEGDSAAAATPPRNRFAWESRSLGAEWARSHGRHARFVVRGWSAGSDAAAHWAGTSPADVRLRAHRRDLGGVASLERADRGVRTVVGLRAERSRTTYHAVPAGEDGPQGLGLAATVPALAAFAEHRRPLGRGVDVGTGLVGTAYGGRPRLAPRLQARWSPWSPLALSAAYARSHQAAQSLRNPESVASYLFPAELYLGAGAGGVPLARSDQAIVAAELRPRPGLRLAAEAYVRALTGLALVAPADAQPFATRSVAVGEGSARGGALDLSLSGARYGLMASYGYTRVRLSYGDSAYVPAFATAHVVHAGAVVFPAASASLRLAATGAFGRRGTPAGGPWEWEACNLLDGGCEFAGSPRVRTEALGGSTLPPYLRLDASARKHWHLRLGGDDGLLGLYVTVANLLGRRNVLTLSEDPATGTRQQVQMLSRGPLVAGIEWRF